MTTICPTTLRELHEVLAPSGSGDWLGRSFPAGGATIRFLTIEDDPIVVESLASAFRMHWPDAEVVSTRLGQKEVKVVEKEAPDIVALDLELPDISGFEALKRIRLFSTVPVIVIGGRGDEADVLRVFELGADDYIGKPFQPMELLARAKALVRGRS
jgi:DNA-binding response OmpR family regulator